jgi:hypothetical protein
MAITLKVGEETPLVTADAVQEEKKTPQVTIKLNARRALDGSVMIFDHKEIDIVIMPEKNKVVTFAKDEMSDQVYEAQDRLFKFLIRKGIVDFNSVQGGNIYSALEANILESKDYNSLQMTLLSISKFLEEERPYYEFETAFEAEEEKRLADPGPQDSTEFDAERQKTKKGSIPPNYQAYGISSVYRL